MAIGDFGSLLQSLTWDEVASYFPAATQVSEGLILIASLRTAAFDDPGLYLYLVSVDADGVLAVVNSRRFDVNAQARPSFPVLVDGSIWAVYYSTGSVARVATFSIAGNTISAEISGTTMHWEAHSSIYQHALVNVRAADGGGFVFLSAGTDQDVDGQMTSVIIQSNGTVGAKITSWEYDQLYGRNPALYKMSDDRVAFVWAYAFGFNGRCEYIDVAADGTFAHQEERLGISVQRGGGIARVGTTNYYVIVSDYGQTTVMIDVIEIPLTGSAHPARADNWFPSDTTADGHPKVMELSRNLLDNGSIFLLIWGGITGDYNCASFQVLDTGDITKSFISTFASIAGDDYPSPGNIVKGIDNVYVVVFEADLNGSNVDVGWAVSVLVEVFAATPTVTTDPASGATAESITLNGTLDLQGAAPSDCGFEWGPDTGYGTTTATQTKSTTETFSQALRGLQPGTTYHFRAFATNLVGTSYGADRSFTTALVITRAYALARQEL